jgi:hypothetical protein
MEKKLGGLKATLAPVGETLKEKLANFKKYLGAAQFNIIAAGPSLDAMLKRWEVEVATQNRNTVVNALIGILPANHGLTRAEIENFLKVGIVQAAASVEGK